MSFGKYNSSIFSSLSLSLSRIHAGQQEEKTRAKEERSNVSQMEALGDVHRLQSSNKQQPPWSLHRPQLIGNTQFVAFSNLENANKFIDLLKMQFTTY